MTVHRPSAWAQTLLATTLLVAPAVAQGTINNDRIFQALGDDHVKALQTRATASGLGQITVVTGDPARTNFPDAACDALFMRNVYHHFADPAAMDGSIAAAVKPGGKVAIVDFTPPGGEAPTPADRGKDGMHGVLPDTVARELKEAGLEPAAPDLGDRRWRVGG